MRESLNTLAPAKARHGLLLPEDEAMARKRSVQRGRIVLKGDRLTLRYCVRDPDKESGWKDCREFLPIGTTAKEAEAVRVKRMETINVLNNSLVTQPSMTLKGFSITLWAEYQQQRKTEPATSYSYASMLGNLILPSFGTMRIDRITPAHITKLMKAAREKYSDKYRLNLYSLLTVMFDVARDYDLITTSPVRAKLHRPDYRRKERRSFTPAQLRALTEHVPEKHKLLCFTLGVLGLRCSELLALQWGDIQDGVLSVRRKFWRGHISERLKTEESKKRIPLGDVLTNLFGQARAEAEFCQDGDFVFSRSRGKPFTSDFIREQILRPAMVAAGIPIVKRESGAHVLRHSAATILYELTRDIELVKRFLRHSRISTTSDIYVHASDLVAAEAVDAMAGVYFQVEGVQ